jgi:hypothetical protein
VNPDSENIGFGDIFASLVDGVDANASEAKIVTKP